MEVVNKVLEHATKPRQTKIMRDSAGNIIGAQQV
jgi:hypothetical protein